MSRLIDADALCERIRKIYDGYMLDEGCTPIEFENMVDEQPTAYDVEKVVAELEEAKKKNFEAFNEATDTWDILCYGNVVNAYGDAISTVKRGGAG